MILYKGQIFDDSMQNHLISTVYEDALETISSSQELIANIVIEACDKLYHRVINHEFDDIVLPLLKMVDLTYDRFLEMAKMFSKEGLKKKLEIELGVNYANLDNLPCGSARFFKPQGILFHIAAGNVDILPAYSVIEGLLVGNINILKLPSGDSGLSVKLLSELIKEAPILKDYIYVFDVPSTEIESIKKLASFADAIVVWGGDEVVEATRKFAAPNTKIISWGHKLSFAYVGKDVTSESLHKLAHAICVSNQVLCSSVQGIYYYDKDTMMEFAKEFFEILKEESNKLANVDLAMSGRNTILAYSASLEKDNKDVFFNGDGVSVIVKNDQELELSYMFRNVWIKHLDEDDIVKVLKKHKDHLQSVALLCKKEDRLRLANKFIKAGIVRITEEDPSRMFLGEAHDGRFALREYCKIVEIDGVF